MNELQGLQGRKTGKPALNGAFEEFRFVAIARHRRHCVKQAAGLALHRLSDMTIDDARHRQRNGWHEVAAVNEAEGDVAEPRRIVVEKLLAAVARAAEGI